MRIRARIFSWACLLVAGSFVLPSPAHAELQSSLDFGLQFFQTSSTPSIGQTGYFLNFQTEPNSRSFRFVYGGSIEANFGSTRVLAGFIKGGVELIAASARKVKPFIALIPQIGWTHVVDNSLGSVGIVYGGTANAGVEIRTGTSERSGGFRITTGYRMLFGNPGGDVLASYLTAYSLSFGVLF